MFKYLNRLGPQARLFRAALVYILVLQLMGPWQLRGNPVGGNVVAGQASINGGAGTLTVNQTSQRAIINWQDFSIQHGELTKFVQPNAASAALNRVVGSNLSGIYGTLQSNGQVYLINPNGIVIGPTGVINTGGFVASTLDVDNNQFMGGGDLTFKGNSTAKVVNLGKIGADSGDVILIAQQVENGGEIKAPNGTAALAAGNEVLVKAPGQERIFVQAGKGSASNSGLIEAATAELKAAGGNEYALAINNSGTVRATGIVNQGGRILLKANTGTVRNTGTLTAKGAKNAKVEVVAQKVEMTDSAQQAAGVWSDGDVLIEGKEGVDLTLLSNADSWISAAGGLTLKSDAVVLGDAHFKSGSFSVQKMDGSAGDFSSPHDPIILSTGDVTMGSYSGLSLHVLAGGSITIGTVSITGADPTVGNSINSSNTATYNGTNTIASLATVTTSTGDSITVDGSTQATLDLRAGINWSTLGGLGSDFTANPPAYSASSATGSAITVGDITISSPAGLVLLTNQYHANTTLSAGTISTGSITASGFTGNGGDVWVDGRAQVFGGSIFTNSGFAGGNGGAISVVANGLIALSDLNSSAQVFAGTSGKGGNIRIKAGGALTMGSSVAIKSFSSGPTAAGNGGNVSLEGKGGLALNYIDSYAGGGGTTGTAGSGGSISINLLNSGFAGADSLSVASTFNSFASGAAGAGNGGSISVNTGTPLNGSIQVGALTSEVYTSGVGAVAGSSGAIDLRASLGITTGNILQSSAGGTAAGGVGGLNVLSSTGNVNLARITRNLSTQGTSGNVEAASIEATQGTVSLIGGIFSFINSANVPGTPGNGGTFTVIGRNGITIDGDIYTRNTSTRTSGAGGNAGSVAIQSSQGAVSVTGLIDTSAVSFSTGNTGNGGNLSISARNQIAMGGAISTRAFTPSGTAGNAGSVSLTSDTSVLNIASGARTIDSYSSGSLASGNGGAVSLNAFGPLSLDTVNTYSRISAAGQAGSGGNVLISLGDRGLTNGSDSLNISGAIDTRSGNQFFGASALVGNGGSVQLSTADGAINYSSISTLTLSTASAGTAGSGGAISLNAGNGGISGGGLNSSTTATGAAGAGGAVTLVAGIGDVNLTSSISTNTTSFAQAGSAGAVIVTANSGGIGLGAVNSSNVLNAAVAAVSGKGGNISLSARDSISVVGSLISQVSSNVSGVASVTGSADAGSVSVTSQLGNISVGSGVITTTSNNSAAGVGNILGNAGDITLQALNGNINLVSTFLNSYSLSNQGQSGNGGTILIKSKTLNLGSTAINSYSQTSGSNSSNAGNGGNVTIDLNFNSSTGGLIFNAIDASSLANSVAGLNSGSGGSISLTAVGNISNSGNAISTYSQSTNLFGSGGNITITGASISIGDLLAYHSGKSGTGKAGDVTLTGQSGNISAGMIRAGSGATLNVGNSGNVSVTASLGGITLTSVDSSNVVSGSSTLAVAGLGGNISLSAGTAIGVSGALTSNVYSELSRVAFGAGTADAGDISVVSQSGSISIGAGIVTTTSNNQSAAQSGNVLGNAGDITLRALNGGISVISSSLNAYSSSYQGRSGNGGTILIETKNLTLGGTPINSYSHTSGSASSNAGNGGNVTINLNFNSSSSGLNFNGIDASSQTDFSSSLNAGSGGSVSLTAVGGISNAGNIISTYSQGSGQFGSGGNISITGASIIVGDLNAYHNGNSGTGSAGDVTLLAQGGSVSAGAIRTDSAAALNVGDSGDVSVTASVGTISLTSVNSSNTAAGVNTAAASGLGGNISLSASGTIAVTGVLNSKVDSGYTSVASVAGTTDAGDISVISQSGNISVGGAIVAATINNSSTFTNGNVLGNAGDITLQALTGNIQVFSTNLDAYSSSYLGRSGNGGAILIKSKTINLGSTILNSYSRTSGSGASHAGSGGNITINLSAGDLNFSVIDASSQVGFGANLNSGSGGAVSLTAAGNVNNFGTSISTYSQGSGQFASGGNISITGLSIAVGSLSAYHSGNNGTGSAGDVILTGQNGNVTAGAIRTDSSGLLNVGDSGDVSVTATTGAITLTSVNTSNTVGGVSTAAVSGLGGNISLSASTGIGVTGALNSKVDSAYSGVAFAAGTADAGDISVISQFGSISVGGGIITTTANNQSSGTVGNVLGNAGDITLQALNGNINAASTSLNAYSSSYQGRSGNGGSILIKGQALSLGNNALYTYSHTTGFNASNAGSGGSVTVNVSNSDLFFGVIDTSSQVGSGANLNSGSGGSVSLTAKGVVSNSGSSILTYSQSMGQMGSGGDISITSNTGVSSSYITVGDLSTYLSGANSTGKAGSVTLLAQSGTVTAGNIRTDSTAVLNVGDSGDVSVTASAGAISLTSVNSSNTISSANTAAASGLGGNISLNAALGVGVTGSLNSKVDSASSGVPSVAGSADAGDISVISQFGNVGVGTGIFTTTTNNQGAGTTGNVLGNAGDITLQALNGLVNIGTTNLDAYSSSYQGQSGKGGAILIDAINLNLGSTAVNSYSRTFGSNSASAGNGGDITINVTNGALSYTSIDASSRAEFAGGPLNSGNGGDVSLSSSNLISGSGISTYSSTSSGVAGSSGNITLTGGGVSVGDLTANVQSGNTVASAPSGFVKVKTTLGNLAVGNVTTAISAAKTAGSSAGLISLESATSLQVTSLDSHNTATGSGLASGNAGDITIKAAGNLTLPGDIYAYSMGHSGSGNGGNVSIKGLGGLSLNSIRTYTTSSETGAVAGNAGSIDIFLNNTGVPGADDLTIGSLSAYASASGGAGNGGTIRIGGIDDTTALNGAVTVTSSLAAYSDTNGDTSVTGASVGSSGSILIRASEGITLPLVRQYSSGVLNAGGTGSLTLVSDTGVISLFGLNKYATGSGIVGGGGDGLIEAKAGTVTVQNSINASTTSTGTSGSTGNSGFITLKGQVGVTVVGNVSTSNTTVQTTGTGGNGGSLTVQSSLGTVNLVGINTKVSSGFFSSNLGNSGSVDISAQNTITLNTATIDATVSTYGAAGNGGNVSIVSTNGQINFSGNIYVDTRGNGTVGNGGSVTISGKGPLSIGTIWTTSRVITQGQGGSSGSVSITLGNQGAMNGADSLSVNAVYSYVGAESPTGSTFLGNAGSVLFSTVDGNITYNGITADSVSNSTTAGNGGSVSMTAGNGKITGGSISTVSNSSLGTGNGGAVTLTAGNGDVDLGSNSISTSTKNNGASGNAGNGGNITLTANNGAIKVGALTSSVNLSGFSNTTGSWGHGGNISLNAGGNIILGTTSTNSFAGYSLAVPVSGSSDAGSVSVISQNGSITAQGTISAIAQSFGFLTGGVLGNSGDITLKALNGNITTSSYLDTSNISTNGRSGNGGAIEVSSKTLTLGGPLYTSAQSQASLGMDAGNGGNVKVTVSNGNLNVGLIETYSVVTGSVPFNSGNGGNVDLTASGTVTTSTSISTYSKSAGGNAGSGGSISINGKNGISLGDFLDASASSSVGTAGSGGDISLVSSLGTLGFSGSPSLLTYAAGVNRVGDGGDLTIQVLGPLNLTANTISVYSELTNGGVGGSGGAIKISLGNSGAMDKADRLTVGNLSTASYVLSPSQPANLGNGGAIELSTLDGDVIYTSLSSVVATADGSAGNGGAVTIVAGNGKIAGGAIDSFTNAMGTTGNGGAVSLTAGDGDVNLVSSTITTNSSNVGTTGNAGKGGAVTITATNGQITVFDIHTQSKLFNTNETGSVSSGGAVNVTAKNDVNIGVINTLSFSGGSAAVLAPGTANGGDISLTSLNGDVVMTNSITASAQGAGGASSAGNVLGDGGNITIKALNGAANLQYTESNALSNFGTSGNGGVVTVTAKAVTVSGIDTGSRTFGDGGSGSGNGGAITLEATAGDLSLNNSINSSSVLSSSTAGASGNGGAISLKASGAVTDSFNFISSGSSSSGLGSGSGGDVSIKSMTGNVVVGSITTSSSVFAGKAGQAGSIGINSAGEITLNSSLMANSSGGVLAGKGGDITLTSVGKISAASSSLSSTSYSSNGLTGGGGDVRVVAGGSVTLSQVTTTSQTNNADGADGGDVYLEATGAIQVTGISTWTDAGQNHDLGDAGNVTVIAHNAGILDGQDGIVISSSIIADSTATTGTLGRAGKGGNISLTTEDGAIQALNPTYISSVGPGGADGSGSLTVAATGGNVGLGYVYASTSSIYGSVGNSGSITISGTAVSVGALETYALSNYADAGNGGAISITATAGNISVGGGLRSYSQTYNSVGTGSGGAVTLKASSDILWLGIDISTSSEVNGGNILLQGNNLLLNNTLSINTDSGTLDGNITVDALASTSNGSGIYLSGGQTSLVELKKGASGLAYLGAFGGEIKISDATTADSIDLRAFGEGGSSGDIFVNGDLNYVTAGASGGFAFLAASDVFFNANVLMNGTGTLTGVAGWDKLTTGSFNTAPTSTQWGNGTGSIGVNSLASTRLVAVGSKNGTTTILGSGVNLVSGSGDPNANARIGSPASGTGNIFVSSKNDISISGNASGSRAVIGNDDFHRGGNVTVQAGRSVLVQNSNSAIEAAGNVVVVVDGLNPARPNSSSTAFLTNNGSVTSDSGTVQFFAVNPNQVTIGTVNQSAGSFDKLYNIYYGDSGALANGVNYKYQPILSFTVDNQSKTYGDTFTFNNTEYTFNGGLEFGDTFADAVSSGPTLSSAGSVDTANVTGSPYAITMAVASTLGYGFNITQGALTVNQRSITVTASGGTKVYGNDDPISAATGYTMTSGSLVFSQSLTGGLGRVAGESTGNYNFTLGSVAVADGNGGNNYAITLDGTTNPFVITKASLTGSIANQSKVYGANDPSLSGVGVTLNGLINRSVTDINGNMTTINDAGQVQNSLASLTRQSGEDVGDYSVTAASFNSLTGSSSGNYSAPSFTGSPILSVTPAGLTGSIANQNKVYGANDPSLSGIGVTLGGLISATVSTWNGSVAIDDSAMSTSLVSLTRAAGEDVGTYSITGANFNTLSGGSAANYGIPVLAGSPTLTVGQANLTGSIANQNKVYGANDPSLSGIGVTLSGLINRTVSTWNGSVAIDDSAAVSTSLASLTRSVGENVGNYTITAANFNALTGSAAGNYSVPIFTGTPTLNITQAGLTGSIANQNKVYGANDPSLSGIAVILGGVVNNTVLTWNGSTSIDDSASVSASLASLTRDAGENVGAYAITAANFNALTGSAAGNYTTPIFVGSPTLDITQASLTGSIANQTKVYGANDPALSGIGVTLGGVINQVVATWNGAVLVDDSASVSTSLVNLTRATGEDVGSYAITAAAFNALSGSAAGNYSVPVFAGTPTLSITQAGLTGSIANQNKVYGANDPALSGIGVTLGGLINRTVSTWNGSVAIDDTSSVSVSLSGLTRDAGKNVGDYAITSLAFNPLAGSASGNYSIPVFTGSPVLNISARSITVTAGSGNSIYGDNPANPGISLTGGSLGFSDTLDSIGLGNDFAVDSSTTVGNYDIQVTGSNLNYTVTRVDGAWAVGQKSLTVTASNQNKTYGDTLTFAGTEFSTNGLINGDAVSNADLSSTGAINTATVAGGPYGITIGNATGTGLSNYDIHYANGSLTLDKRDVTVTANGGTSTYGDSPSNPGLSASNLASFDDVNALTGLNNSFNITGTTAAGDHTLTVDGTLINSNYNVTSRVDGTWVVGQKSLTVTANDQTKTYGDTLTFSGTEFSTNGLINGDAVSAADLASTGAIDTAAVAGGPYAVTIGNATGSGLGNYDIHYVSGSLTLDKRDITVTANSGTSIYGNTSSNPGLSATNLASFDDASVLTGLSNSYGINGTTGVSSSTLSVNGTLTNSNYNLTGTTDGNWTVTARNITVTANSGQGKVYGNLDPALAYTVGGLGLANGDTLSGVMDRALGENVGGYLIGQGTLAADANYNLSLFTGSSFAIARRPITVTAGSGGSIYGQPANNPGIALTGGSFAFADTLSSLGLGDDFLITDSTMVGDYPIHVTGSGSSNYLIRRIDGKWVVSNPVNIFNGLSSQFQSGQTSDEQDAVDGVTDYTGSGTATFSYGPDGTPSVPGAILQVSSGDVK